MSRYIEADALLMELEMTEDLSAYDVIVFEEIVNEQPTADVVERKRGEWKVSNLPKGRKLKYCSECGFGQNMNDDRIYNYCPNCGADMRGDNND